MKFDVTEAVVATDDGTEIIEDPGADFESRMLVVPTDRGSRLIPFERVRELRGERADRRIEAEAPGEGPDRL